MQQITNLSMAMFRRLMLASALLAAAGLAHAQLYRWTDEKGRIHLTDIPPPASARNVQKRSAQSPKSEVQTPFQVEMARKNYPVTLYSSPGCAAPCKLARDALNRRGVPFSEVQVWDAETNEKLKQVSGGNDVPVLVIGQTVQKGFDEKTFGELLDSAGYPRAGILPPRNQPEPPMPEDYEREARKPVAEPIPDGPAPKPGPYSPR